MNLTLQQPPPEFPIPNQQSPEPIQQNPEPNQQGLEQSNNDSSLTELLDDTFSIARGNEELTDSVTEPTEPQREISPAFSDHSGEIMSIDESKKHTATLIDMRETIQSMGLALLSDGNVADYKQFNYAPWAKSLLVDAWHPIIQQYNLKVNPYVHILYAEGITAGPLIALALKNRKLRLKQEEQAEIIRRQNQKIAKLEEAANAAEMQAETSVKSLRPDTKNQWKIDEKGFFENDRRGTYIKKPERKERAELTTESYPLLCKHNGKAFVDKVFNV
jgi:hypothetical protein